MNNSKLLSLTTTAKDKVICEDCKIGIMLPACPEAHINHGFTCSHCGSVVNIDSDVTVD